MDVQKNVCFVSKLRYLNVQKSPGYVINKPIPGGGTVAVQEIPEFIKFKDHRLLTNSQEIIDFIRDISVKKPQLGIKEIKIKTKQEQYEDEMAKLQEQIKRVNEAKGKLSPTEEEKKEKREEIVESAKEVAKKLPERKPFRCWLGNCMASANTLQGLQKHLNDFHRKKMTKENIIRKLNNLAKEDEARKSYKDIRKLAEEENKIGDVQTLQ